MTRAAELDADRTDYIVLLALELANAERFEEARVQFERVIELGGTEEYPGERLEALHSDFVARRDLAELIPLSAEVEHDHFVGGCPGVLTMDAVNISFESSKNPEHSFSTEISSVGSFERKDRDLVLRIGNKNYRFRLDSPESFLEVYQLVQQISLAEE